MSQNSRFLIAESETDHARRQRMASTGRSNGETYRATLQAIVPEAECEIVRPIGSGADARPSAALSDYDAVFLSGSPMHAYEETPEVRRVLDFMRAVFASQTPSFGSCAGLQIAVVAAGGRVRENRKGHEVAFARRIVPTEAGCAHPLLHGRPHAFDALTIHSDEVEALPPTDAVVLAGNEVTAVQAAEVRFDGGVFWGIQYHPELPIHEIADAVRRQSDDVVEQGLARDASDVEAHAALIEALGREPDRSDLAWRLGVDRQITSDRLRQTELRNFIDRLVVPTMASRARG